MTDSDNTQPQDAERRQLARALHLPDGLPVAALIAGAEEQRIDLAAVRAAHESRRRTLSGALGLVPGAGWDAILDCATKTRTAAVERAAALHDARDALGAAGYGPDASDWPAAAPAIRKLAADLELRRGNSEVDRREAGSRREALAAALGQPPSRPWSDLIATARAAVAGRGTHRDEADAAEAALDRVRKAAHLHRQGLIEYTDLYAAIDGPMDPVHILGAEPNSTRGGDQPAQSQPDDGDRVVAYVSIYRPGLLYCRTCAGDRVGLRPVTSEDLLDGGICYSCGVDVLAEAQPERCGQYAGHGEYCDYPREPGGELCAVHSAEQVREQPEPKRSGIFAGVQGHCPACGRTALILGTGGYVTCGNLDCPQPDAATTLLERDVREQPAEPPLRGPSADAAPHIAFAISSYLAALVPLADALRDALGEQR